MRIKIKQPLRLISHKMGISALIPGASFSLEAYPTKLLVKDLITFKTYEVSWDLKGPLEGFTFEMDLQKDIFCLYGKPFRKKGFFRLLFYIQDEYFQMELDKHFEEELTIYQEGKALNLKPKSTLSFFPAQARALNPKEKLFLGVSKQLLWEKVEERRDLKEFLPLWFYLGQKMPKFPEGRKQEGCLKEYHLLKEAIDAKDIAAMEISLIKLIRGAFKGMFIPTLQDECYQGLWKCRVEGYPLEILKGGYQLIRQLFLEEKGKDHIAVLPRLPSTFISGRMTGLEVFGGEVNLEWTKGTLRRMDLLFPEDRQVRLQLPKTIKRFRIQAHLKERGHFVSASQVINLKSQKRIYLDRFES